jgi:hypothetical protein
MDYERCVLDFPIDPEGSSIRVFPELVNRVLDWIVERLSTGVRG